MSGDAPSWMSTRDALSHVASEIGDELLAMEELRRLATNGAIPTRGKRIDAKAASDLHRVFWQRWADADGAPAAVEQDWDRGIFAGREPSGRFVRASQVEFDAQAVRSLFPAGKVGGRRQGGRKSASWWPEALAEVVVYFEEEGLPPGAGSEGSEAVIEAILKRLSDRNIDASRTSLQPGVTEALRRMRQSRGI